VMGRSLSSPAALPGHLESRGPRGKQTATETGSSVGRSAVLAPGTVAPPGSSRVGPPGDGPGGDRGRARAAPGRCTRRRTRGRPLGRGGRRTRPGRVGRLERGRPAYLGAGRVVVPR